MLNDGFTDDLDQGSVMHIRFIIAIDNISYIEMGAFLNDSVL